MTSFFEKFIKNTILFFIQMFDDVNCKNYMDIQEHENLNNEENTNFKIPEMHNLRYT